MGQEEIAGNGSKDETDKVRIPAGEGRDGEERGTEVATLNHGGNDLTEDMFIGTGGRYHFRHINGDEV
ncbi:hypothetical protein HPP92_023515 [Vanilla planifolia]|uniref:Uncharacterized protein n=1 Tax=Vanilla planifolia TaxID=51239 RepID=A0A835PW94_VANPL|nr:hypothetical protein HPP92_023515 [Vanilla planifolia]